MTIRAGGCIFISKNTKRVFLLLRNHTVKNPLTWSFVGGKIEGKETILQGISREVREEIGFLPEYISVTPVDVFNSIDGNFNYYTVAVIVENEFLPEINYESAGYGWFDMNYLPKPIIEGAKRILLNNSFKKVLRELSI